MPNPKRSIDIVQPKYHPSSKPDEAASALSKDDVMMLLEKSKRSQTKLPDGTVAPRPDGPAEGGLPPQPGTPPPRPGRRLLTVLIGTVALVAAVFFGVQAGSRLFDSWADLSPVTAENNETASNDTATNSNTDTAANTATNTPATNTPAAPVAETPAATPTATKVSVKVLNGNGIAGDAAKVKAQLETAGITVAATGNAKSFGYATTIVYYSAGKKESADKVAAALTGRTVSVSENAVADGYDSLVVIGAK